MGSKVPISLQLCVFGLLIMNPAFLFGFLLSKSNFVTFLPSKSLKNVNDSGYQVFVQKYGAEEDKRSTWP